MFSAEISQWLWCHKCWQVLDRFFQRISYQFFSCEAFQVLRGSQALAQLTRYLLSTDAWNLFLTLWWEGRMKTQMFHPALWFDSTWMIKLLSLRLWFNRLHNLPIDLEKRSFAWPKSHLHLVQKLVNLESVQLNLWGSKEWEFRKVHQNLIFLRLRKLIEQKRRSLKGLVHLVQFLGGFHYWNKYFIFIQATTD